MERAREEEEEREGMGRRKEVRSRTFQVSFSYESVTGELDTRRMASPSGRK